MKRLRTVLLFMLFPAWLLAQRDDAAVNFLQDDCQRNGIAFEKAYAAYPQVPRGLLEAVSFTNTHIHHLTDNDYVHDAASAMPRTYGLMGLVADGKQWFRENLYEVSRLSGIGVAEILSNPELHVRAYAAALASLARGKELEQWLSAVRQLSELPTDDERDAFPMQAMLYSVCNFLNDEENARCFGFERYAIDMQSAFGDMLPVLSAKNILLSGDTDFPKAIWRPADSTNYSERTDPVSGVVVHYTEGSYAGCISWFQNPASNVSAHYVVRSSDGQVTQMVREADKAWHARSANAYTIGIEHEAYGDIVSYFTEAMYASSADLVRDICSRYETIEGHRTFYRDTLDNGACLNKGVHDLGDVTACTKIRGHQHYPGQTHTDPGPYWDWNYYYKLINPEMEVEVLEGMSGTLNHEDYSDDERKIWVVKGPDDAVMELYFRTFSLEKDYDFLWIYDGDNVFAPKIGRWNTMSPGRVVASGNVLCVEFRSDCGATDKGWQADWEAVLPEPPAPDLGFGIFPNPATSEIHIRLEENAFHDAAIYDVFGNKVSSNVRFLKETVLPVEKLSAGIYFVRYGKVSEMNGVFKFVKM